MKTNSVKTVRRTLGTLQPSAIDQAVLVGSGGKISVDKKKVDTKRRRLNFDLENKPPSGLLAKKDEKEMKLKAQPQRELDIFVDPQVNVVAEDAYNLILRDDASDDYWKQLAEERRIALERALEENRRLHEDMEILEAENKHLQKMADHCAELADIVKTLTADEELDENGNNRMD